MKAASIALAVLLGMGMAVSASAQHYHHHDDGTWWDDGYHDHNHNHNGWYNDDGHYDHGTYYYDDDYTHGHNHVHNHYPSYQSGSITYGGFSHVDNLAMQLESAANEFCLDLHYNYQHNAGFDATYREAYKILEIARDIHTSEHQNDRATMAELVGQIDPLFHHVQGDVGRWSRHYHRQIGSTSTNGKMAKMQSLIHHLSRDVGIGPR